MSADGIRRVVQWPLRVVAGLLALAATAFAVYLAHPTEATSGPGGIAAVVLIFPLHLLAVAAFAAGLWLLARRLGARHTGAVLGLVAAATAILALWPSIAMWRFAERENVALSLGDYVANAGRLEWGGPRPERTVQYGTAADGSRLVLDVWLSDAPDAGAPRPAIVKLHGGGWVGGRRSEAIDWNRWLNRLGYHVFDVAYRLPPPARWKDEVGDVKCAIGWVAANAGRYGIDPARISTMGFSAGGNLAMLAAYSMDDPRLPPSCDAPAVAVRSVVNLYGPADLTLLYETGNSPDQLRNAMKRYIGGPPTRFPARYRAVSPLTYVSATVPPTITVLGTRDHIVPADQAETLDRALAAARATRETYLLPYNDHAFEANWGGFGAQFAREKIRAFLQIHG